jgi:hypothetical protein
VVVNEMRAFRGAAVAALFLAAVFASAQSSAGQSSAPEQAAPRRILVSFERAFLSGYSAEEIGVLKQSFLLALSEADRAPSPVDYGAKPLPGRTADRDKAAREVGADCWLAAVIEGARAQPRIRVVSRDMLYDTTSVDISVSRKEPFAMMDVYRERWDDIVGKVVAAYPPLSPAAFSQGPPPALPLKIHALPGTVITGLSMQPLAVGPDGISSVELASPAPYTLRAALGGYLPSIVSFYYRGEGDMPVTQVRPPWLFLDLAFLNGFFPGVSATVAFSPFPGFLRLGYTTFRAGITFGDTLFISLPLSQITLLGGIYLSPVDSPTRIYVGIGPLLRLSLPSSGSLVVDGLLPWGVQAVGGVEFTLGGNWRFMLEYAPTLYSAPVADLLRYYFGSNNGGSTFPYFIFPPFALNVVEVRMGLRLSL